MQVSALEVDSDPAAADLFIHVLNALTCPLDQKLRAFKMHTKVGARSSILSYAVSYALAESYVIPDVEGRPVSTHRCIPSYQVLT